MKQLDILKTIYNFLKLNTATVNDVIQHLQNVNISRSDRQVKRDLKDVKEFFLNDNEEMEILKVNRAYEYKIIHKNKTQNLSQKTVNTLSLALAASPNILLENRTSEIDYLQNLVKTEIGKSEKLSKFNNIRTQLINTNFYEIKKETLFDKNIDLIIEAIALHKIIKIIELINDYSVDNSKQTVNKIMFLPIKIIYHRGAFWVAGFAKTNIKEIAIFEISQLKKVEIQNESFIKEIFIEKLENELANRFGITKNIDDKIYDIKLEFTNITGSLVQKYTWHHSQKFNLIGGNHFMTLRCGINRELMGWIFQWMYNVRIIEPQILIDKFDETLNLIQKRQKNDAGFTYFNIFEPK